MKISPINSVQQRRINRNKAVHNQPNFGNKRKVTSLLPKIISTAIVPLGIIKAIANATDTVGVSSGYIINGGDIDE